jgi:hypothetical protein
MEVDAAHRFRSAKANVQIMDIKQRRHLAIL